MQQILQTSSMAIFAIIGFGILVFVHELGHFLCAKFFGIQVEVFALGWGPKLWGIKKGGTTYQISVFPIGGFCKFKGDELSEDLKEEDRDPNSFYGAAPYKRLLVAFFGPLTNFIVAIIFLTILAMGSFTEKYRPNRIIVRDDIMENATVSPAKRAGILTGDRIVKLGKRDITSFEDLSRYMLMLGGKKEVDVTVIRDGKELVLTVKPDWDKEQLKPVLGVLFYLETLKVHHPGESSLYEFLELKEGDIITGLETPGSINLVLVNGILREEYKLINEKKEQDPSYVHDKTLVLHITRNGTNSTIKADYETLYNSIPKDQWLIHYYQLERPVKGKHVFAAISSGFKESYEIIVISAIGLYSLMFKPKKDVKKQLGGPIMIGYVIGSVTVEGFKESFYTGLRNFFSIISYISLALAFFNLLPIPAVDGGHIILNLFEIITRKTIKLKIVQAINMIGFALLIFLALIIAFVDISKFFPGQ